MHQLPFRRVAAFLCLASLVLSLPLGATEKEPVPLTPKGIYHAVDEYQRTGVKLFVELRESSRRSRRVPVNHNFRTGDRFTFSFEINRDSYIYVINQTLDDMRTGSGIVPASFESKGIERIPVPPPPPAPPPPARIGYVGEPRLLFPTYKAGSNNRLRRDKPYAVPTRGYYRMDEQAGTERLFVVISDTRLDLSSYFYSDSGRIRGTRFGDRLRRKLGEWKRNAEVELVDKGIVHDVASYGVSIDPAKPAVIEIDLRHCRR